MDVVGPLLSASGRKSRRPATSKSIILEKINKLSYYIFKNSDGKYFMCWYALIFFFFWKNPVGA